MNEVPVTLRPETLALDALIQKTLAQAGGSVGQRPADTMVFLGNRHQSFPTVVVTDPVLEPVDKLVWMVIMLAVRETGGRTAFPSYESIGKLVNVSSRSTIARAIAILRASRWLTLCSRARKANGRFRSNVYAVHDEPLPLADALHLDSNYMAFLGHAQGHGHARVRAIAQGVLDSIDQDIQAGQAVCVQPHLIERRLQSIVATKGGEPNRFFSFTRNVVRWLRSDSTKHKKGGIHHDQNSNSGCSSSYINKTTTTKTGGLSNFTLTGDGNQPLVYPTRLCANHREIAARALSALAPEQRQPILDELAGRFLAEKRGMKPVYDELSFLHSLCKLMRQGKFQPNLGIRVRDGRRDRKNNGPKVPPMKSARPLRETNAQRQKRKAAGKAQVAEMRKLLGMRAPTGNQEVTGES